LPNAVAAKSMESDLRKSCSALSLKVQMKLTLRLKLSDRFTIEKKLVMFLSREWQTSV
jgi:hypothetical protein